MTTASSIPAKRADLAVIGGGPAGMMAAIAAAERGAAVVLLEPNERLGKKLNITGKGRCNVTSNAGAEELLERERRQCVGLYERKAGRSRELVELALTTLLRLERSAKGLKVETTIHNTAKDHRIRVMIPTGLQTETHFADSTLEVVERPNRHGKAWQNPSGCEHQQNFVAMHEEKDGILVANFGLYEYEVLPDRDNAIDVYMSDEYMDVLADGSWERIFRAKPPVFTRQEKREWLDQMQDVTLGSDAFFPFSDNIERAYKSGVKYIAQPGGSVRDDAVIQCCDQYDMVMAFTGIRLFHH